MQYSGFSIQNKVALVTGASKGIGRGIAKALSEAGAKVAVVARNINELDGLVHEIHAAGGEAKSFPLDVQNGMCYHIYRSAGLVQSPM
jgi:NADP-dependent 3-hydroxy acid dehydrogenase YdfG